MARTKTEPPTNINDPRYLKALAHPTRIRVLAMLRERRASPVELSDRLGESLGTVAYHVRTLKNLGLIKLVATRQRRGATEHIYEAVEHPRFSDGAWDAVSPVGKQRLLSAMLQQAGEYAAGSAAAGGFDRSDAAIARASLKLDEKGWTQLAKAAKKWLAEVDKIEQGALERMKGDPHAEPLDVGVVTMLFEAVPLSDRVAKGIEDAADGAAPRPKRRSSLRD